MISRFFVMCISQLLKANNHKRPCRLLLTLLSLSPLILVSPSTVHASWFQQQSGTTANLLKVFFVNSQTGWAAGDSSLVLRTTDGGNLWTRSIYDTVFGKSEAFWFWDSTLGWVADSNGLYKTTDGGINWRFLQNLSGAHFRDVVFVTPLKGWVTKVSGPDSFGFYGARLYRSSDGGTTWVIRDSSTRWGFWKISFADSMFGMLAEGSPGGFHFDSQGDTRRTTDGGETWQVLPSIPDSMDFPGFPMYSNVHLLDRSYAWRASYTLTWYMGLPFYGSGIYKTTAGGDTWTRIINGYVGQNVPDGLSFEIVDTLKGFILNSDNLRGTLDGGATWVTLSLPGVKRDINFQDSLNGWIVGDQGLILHTTDGGLGVWSDEISPRSTVYILQSGVVPNPFTSFASVPGHSSDRFTLFDISGRKVGVYSGNRVGWDVSPGVYFLRSTNNKDKPLRIVKVR